WVPVAGLLLLGLAAAPVFPLLTLATAARTGASAATCTVTLQVAASAVGSASDRGLCCAGRCPVRRARTYLTGCAAGALTLAAALAPALAFGATPPRPAGPGGWRTVASLARPRWIPVRPGRRRPVNLGRRRRGRQAHQRPDRPASGSSGLGELIIERRSLDAFPGQA